MGQMKVWIEVLQLASRLNLKYLRRFIFLMFLPHFCFLWGRPWGNHAKCCMDGNLSSTVSQLFEPQVQKIAVFTYHSPHVLFPLVAWMERQFIACQTPRSMYLSIFNSFRVIRCLSQCISPKIAIFTTFLFPLGTPLGQSRYMLYGWKKNSMLTNCFAACTHLSSTVSSYSNRKCKKSPFSRTAAHIFVSPGDALASITQCVACCMDGKRIQCLPNASQHVLIYFQ